MTVKKKHPELPIRAVFLGYAQTDPAHKLQAIREHVSTNDWTSRLDTHTLQDLVQQQIAFSRSLQAECSLWMLPYVEMSADSHAATLEQALAILVRRT